LLRGVSAEVSIDVSIDVSDEAVFHITGHNLFARTSPMRSPERAVSNGSWSFCFLFEPFCAKMKEKREIHQTLMTSSSDIEGAFWVPAQSSWWAVYDDFWSRYRRLEITQTLQQLWRRCLILTKEFSLAILMWWMLILPVGVLVCNAYARKLVILSIDWSSMFMSDVLTQGFRNQTEWGR
jgi:hypothetical protein